MRACSSNSLLHSSLERTRVWGENSFLKNHTFIYLQKEKKRKEKKLGMGETSFTQKYYNEFPLVKSVIKVLYICS